MKVLKNLIVTFIFLFFACSNHEEDIKNYEKTDFPSSEITGLKSTFIDSGLIVYTIKAARMLEYNQSDKNYREFPEGIEIKAFEKESIQAGFMKADYAIIYNTDTSVYKAEKNVVIVTKNFDTITTDQIFWDKQKELFYNSVYTQIRQNGVAVINSYGGVEVKQDMSKYQLKKNSGVVKGKGIIKK